MNDLRFAIRQLVTNPGFTAVAVLTLGLCLGANLAIFAVVNSVLLRPLPFPEAGRLVTLFNTYPKAGVERTGASLPNYYERRGNIPAFSHVAMFRYDRAIIGEAGSTEQEEVMRVSPEFFLTLGSGPVMGRAFTEEETTYQTDGVAILTDEYWRQRFNADPNVLGRQLRVDGVQKTIVGVLPPDFRFLSAKARLYFPLSSNPQDRETKQRHSNQDQEIVARLQPGASLAAAQAQIDAHNAAHAAEYPNPKMIAEAGFRTIVTPLHADHVKSVRLILLLVQAGVFFLLLIGGVNLINLLLVRASGRRPGIGDPPGAGREPLAGGEAGDDGNRFAHLHRRTLQPRRRRWWNSAPGCPGRASAPAGGAPRVRRPVGRGSHARSRNRRACRLGADCVVQPARRSCQPAAIRNPRRHGQPCRAAPAPRVHRRADRARLRPGRRSRPARSKPETCHGRFSRLSTGPPSHRTNLSAVEKLSGLDAPPDLC